MKRNILVTVFAIMMAFIFSFTFTGCKKADKSASAVTEEKKPGASTGSVDKAGDMKKEVDNASGFNFK